MSIRPWSLVARRRSGRARIFLFFSASLTQPLLLCFTFGKYFRQNHRLLDQMTCFVAPPSQQRQALDQILELNNSGDCSQHPGKSEQISISLFVIISPGQTLLMQASVWTERPSHGTPPNNASVSLNLWFSRTPSPQVTEHVPSVQSLQTQSTKNIIWAHIRFKENFFRDIMNSKCFLLTWAFLNVAAFLNSMWAWTFFTAKLSFNLFLSCFGQHSSSASQRAFS